MWQQFLIFDYTFDMFEIQYTCTHKHHVIKVSQASIHDSRITLQCSYIHIKERNTGKNNYVHVIKQKYDMSNSRTSL